MTRSRIIAAAASALLGLAGLTGLSTPAHAADRPNATTYPSSPCWGRIGDTIHPASPFPVSCTDAIFSAPWYPAARSQTQRGELTVTDHAGYAVHLDPTSPSQANIGGTSAGGSTERLLIPASGLTIPAHHSATVAVTVTAYGPYQAEINPPGADGAPVATTSISVPVDVSGPWGPTPDQLFAVANYPVAAGYPPGYAGPRYAVSATVGAHSAGQPATIRVTNTSAIGEHLVLCNLAGAAGTINPGGHPIAGGIRGPGGAIVHAVSDPHVALGGTLHLAAYASPSWGCDGIEQPLAVTWPARAAVRLPPGAAQVGLAASNPDPGRGQSVELAATNIDPNAGNSWLTICRDGRAISSGARRPATSLVTHAVGTGAVTYTAHEGTPADCSTPTLATTTVTWQAGGPASYVHRMAVEPSVTVAPAGVPVPIDVVALQPGWLSLCSGQHLLASGWHPAGGVLEHAVLGSGTQSWTATAAARSCGGPLVQGASVVITWTN